MDSINFENVEKVATFIITPDGLGVDDKLSELKTAGFNDFEIDIGRTMAIQACLMIVLSRTYENGSSVWKKQEDPKA